MSEARVPHNKQQIDEQFIIDNYMDMSAREIGEILGVSRETISGRMRSLGLRKTKIPYVALQGEEIREIKGVPGYGITNLGRVVNLKENWILKYKIDDVGYPKVTLFVNKKPVDKRIHRILAEAFIENPENLPQVNHIDGDKTNFSIDNLEWVTAKENSIHAILTGLSKSCENHPNAKITNEQARGILNDFSILGSIADVKKRNPHISSSIVEKICRKERWVHLERAETSRKA